MATDSCGALERSDEEVFTGCVMSKPYVDNDFPVCSSTSAVLEHLSPTLSQHPTICRTENHCTISVIHN